MEKPGGLQFTGSQRVGHDWATSLSVFVKVSFYVDSRSSFTGFRFCSLEGIALSSVFSVLHVCVCVCVCVHVHTCVSKHAHLNYILPHSHPLIASSKEVPWKCVLIGVYTASTAFILLLNVWGQRNGLIFNRESHNYIKLLLFLVTQFPQKKDSKGHLLPSTNIFVPVSFFFFFLDIGLKMALFLKFLQIYLFSFSTRLLEIIGLGGKERPLVCTLSQGWVILFNGKLDGHLSLKQLLTHLLDFEARAAGFFN